MPPLVQDLIAAARIRHWSFTDVELGDGPALLFLNQRQRTHLASHGANIEGIVGDTLEYGLGANATGAVVALDSTGVPVYSTTTDTGYPVHLTADGVPYIDTTDTPVTRDPFGANGGTPGFPLPSDFVRLIDVAGIARGNNRIVRIDVVAQQQRYDFQPGRSLACFVGGNRLVPILPLASENTGSRWMELIGVQISYVGVPTFTSLTDVVTIPTVLCEALTADLALLFARQSRTCDKADKASMEREAAACAQAVSDAGLDLLESVTHNSVLFRG